MAFVLQGAFRKTINKYLDLCSIKLSWIKLDLIGWNHFPLYKSGEQ